MAIDATIVSLTFISGTLPRPDGRVGLPRLVMREAIEEIADGARAAIALTEGALPEGFPSAIPDSASGAVMQRLRGVTIATATLA